MEYVKLLAMMLFAIGCVDVGLRRLNNCSHGFLVKEEQESHMVIQEHRHDEQRLQGLERACVADDQVGSHEACNIDQWYDMNIAMNA